MRVIIYLFIGHLLIFSIGCYQKKTEDIGIIIPKTQYPIVETTNQTSKRVTDLTNIAIALEKYKQKNRSYPLSADNGKAWSRYINEKGIKNPIWIEGLIPAYVDSLPHESEYIGIYKKQYVYKSDGANYKLLSLRPSDFSNIKQLHPTLVDKARAYEAYGYWTVRAEGW